MAKRTAWRNEKRTGLELIRLWVAAQKNQAEAARLLGLSPQRLWGFLHVSARGLDPKGSQTVARIIGLPFEAVVFKDEPVCDVVRRSTDADAAGSGASAA